MLVVGHPQVGELWRYRYGSGSAIVIREVTDVVIRYSHAGYPDTTFGNPVRSWHDMFEPVPLEN